MNSVWPRCSRKCGFAADRHAGHKDKFYDFSRPLQDKLRSKGKRIFGLGYSMAAKEAWMRQSVPKFLVSYGGVGSSRRTAS